MELWQIDSDWACAGVWVVEGKIVDTAPIYKWMVGKFLTQIQKWRHFRRATRVWDGRAFK